MMNNLENEALAHLRGLPIAAIERVCNLAIDEKLTEILKHEQAHEQAERRRKTQFMMDMINSDHLIGGGSQWTDAR